MRGWVSAVANYSEPVALGAVMRSLAVGRVDESRHGDFESGDYVTGLFGWQDYAVVDGKTIQRKALMPRNLRHHIGSLARVRSSYGLHRTRAGAARTGEAGR